MRKIFATLLLAVLTTGCLANENAVHTPSEASTADGVSLHLVQSPEGNYELKWPTRDVFEKIGHPFQSGDKLRALFPDQFQRNSPEITYAFHTEPSEDQGLYFQHFPTDKQIRTTLIEVDAQLNPHNTLSPNVHTLSADPRGNKDIVHKFPFRVDAVMPEKTDALYILLTELVEKDGSVSDSIVQIYYIPGKVIHAEISTDKTVYTPGDELQLMITNLGPTNLTHNGKRYDLEKKNKDGWELLNERKPGTSMTLEGYSPITVGDYTQNIKLPDDLKPGTYRIVKSVGADLADYGTELSVTFEVK
ncbi:hypothetical protein KP806_17800 [Paenibacillus sp. N4]|uniref:immunoglobulin-like domain-containing protein n=1 Tax=Paenibacillus vietnamensis TaxID=2590547 RepID=UPI001CD15ECD|nr:immunoglobulin-like domain-containing protein [Paenibacillus vietnamensis]MCA0756916.1 hypothetical protein [Paenibacillus vietnamensis]